MKSQYITQNINYPTMGRKGDAEVGNKKRADTNYRLDDGERMMI